MFNSTCVVIVLLCIIVDTLLYILLHNNIRFRLVCDALLSLVLLLLKQPLPLNILKVAATFYLVREIFLSITTTRAEASAYYYYSLFTIHLERTLPLLKSITTDRRSLVSSLPLGSKFGQTVLTVRATNRLR